MDDKPLTDHDLDEMEARCKAATPGPWRASDDEPSDVVIWGPADKFLVNVGADAIVPMSNTTGGAVLAFDADRLNAEFMAHARTDLPRVLAELRELRRLARETEAKYQAHSEWMQEEFDMPGKKSPDWFGHLAALKAAAGGGE